MNKVKGLLTSSLVFSILYFLFIIFRKNNYGKYRKQTFRLIWIILILRLLVPSGGLVSKIPFQFNMINRIAQEIPITLNSDISARTSNLLQSFQVSWEFFRYFNKIWTAGFIISILILCGHYFYFRVSLKKSLVEDSPKTEQLRNTYKLHVPIRITEKNTSPFVTGIFGKTLVLPQSLIRMAEQKDLDYIIQHEMIHIKKNDTLIKILYLIVRCIHWFNPLVYMMNKEFSMDLEMACDEALAETLNENEKREYCNVLYRYSIATSLSYSIYNMALSPGGIRLKERFDSILSPNKKYGRGIIILVCLLVAFIPFFIKTEQANSHQPGATTINYIDNGDILIKSEKLVDPIILRKIEENSFALEFTKTIPRIVDFKDILDSETVISHISKDDYKILSGLQLTISQKNE